MFDSVRAEDTTGRVPRWAGKVLWALALGLQVLAAWFLVAETLGWLR